MALLTTMVLTGCSAAAGADEAENELHLFNWGLFLNPDLLDTFYEEYGIRVITSYYSSNEALYTRLTAGTDQFDLLVPSDYMVYRLIAENLLQPIDMESVPNIENIYSRLLGQDFDPENTFSVPYKWGTLGILYNTTMVNHEVTSWESLFMEEYAGQILMYNSERDALGMALKKLGYSMNSTTPEEIDAARDLLIEQLPLVQAYVTDEGMTLMINGDAAMFKTYSGDAAWSIRYNPDLNYVVPSEGSNLWINSLVIPHNARNAEGAKKFINFLLRPDIAGLNTNWVGYTTANEVAIEEGYVDAFLLEIPGFVITDEEYERLEVFVDLGEDRELKTNAFTQILAQR